MALNQDDYFTVSRVLESFAKTYEISVGEGATEKQKRMIISILLKSPAKVKHFRFSTANVKGEDLKKLLVSAGYADNLKTEELSDLEKIELNMFEPEISEENDLIAPYSADSNPERVYRFIFNITKYDGSTDLPDFRAIWKNSPLTVYAEVDGLVDDPKLEVLLDIADCEELIKKMEELIDSVADTLEASDVEFLKNIVNGSSQTCELPGVELENFLLPTFEEESILYEISNIDKLVCYLKQQIIKYKTEIVTVSSNGTCYKFVNCLIKGYVNLNKLYRQATHMYNTLLSSASTLKDKYVGLAADHRRGITAIKSINSSMSEWIVKNLDDEFNLDKVTCSNTVEQVGGVNYSFKEKYSKHYNSSTKKYEA